MCSHLGIRGHCGSLQVDAHQFKGFGRGVSPRSAGHTRPVQAQLGSSGAGTHRPQRTQAEVRCRSRWHFHTYTATPRCAPWWRSRTRRMAQGAAAPLLLRRALQSLAATSRKQCADCKRRVHAPYAWGVGSGGKCAVLDPPLADSASPILCRSHR